MKSLRRVVIPPLLAAAKSSFTPAFSVDIPHHLYAVGREYKTITIGLPNLALLPEYRIDVY